MEQGNISYDLKNEPTAFDPLYERKHCIKKGLLKYIYKQLIVTIIEYDYDFSGKSYKIFDTNDYIFSLCGLSDYQIICYCLGYSLKIWDLNNHNYETISHTYQGICRTITCTNVNIITKCNNIPITCTNGNIITIRWHDNTLRPGSWSINIWNHDNKYVSNILTEEIIKSVICMPNGKIVTFTNCYYSNRRHIIIWNTDNGNPEIVIKNNPRIMCIDVLTDQLFISGNNDGIVDIWDSISGKCECRFVGHKLAVLCLCIHPNKLIVSGSQDETIKIWNYHGQCINTLEGHNASVKNVSILPNGMLISQSQKLLKMWDPANGECISSWRKKDINHCTVLKNGLVACVEEHTKICIYY